MEWGGSVLGALGPFGGPAGAVALAMALLAVLASGTAWVLWRRLQRVSAHAADTVPAAVPAVPPAPAAPAAPRMLHAGLVPREQLDEALAAAERRAPPGPGSLCVLVVDIDGFARVNEALGHDRADRVLRTLAQRLDALTPGKLAFSRLGGDEFVLALETPLAQAEALAARLLATIGRPLDEAAGFGLSASVGIAAWPQHGARERLLAQAQLAMRSVKQTGGNAWARFDPRMADDQRAQAALVRVLRDAVARRQFELVYQPKIDARTLRVTAAEALLRWHHPQHGVVSPAVFVPLAERHGLIGEIGNWVIGEACRQAGVWRRQGLRMRVAINLSAYQMRQDDLADRLVAALAANGLQPGRFTVEITETLALESTRATQVAFERLREAGLHVAIDDFGAGQTCLAYLRDLPASELKMDIGLVRDIAVSEDARKIADAVIRLAHALDKRVVAEGVETAEQRDLLVAMGCDELQGYLFARPMSANALGLWATDGGTDDARHRDFAHSLFQDTQTPA